MQSFFPARCMSEFVVLSKEEGALREDLPSLWWFPARGGARLVSGCLEGSGGNFVGRLGSWATRWLGSGVVIALKGPLYWPQTHTGMDGE